MKRGVKKRRNKVLLSEKISRNLSKTRRKGQEKEKEGGRNPFCKLIFFQFVVHEKVDDGGSLSMKILFGVENETWMLPQCE